MLSEMDSRRINFTTPWTIISDDRFTERETCCLLDDCGGRSVNASSTPCMSSSRGGIIGVFMSIVIVSVSEAMVKLGEGIIVYVTNVIRKLFNNL
jgi:hypothetical protein